MSSINEQKTTLYTAPSFASVDLSAVRHNFLALQSMAHQQMVAGHHRHMELITVIKADAYGHGMIEVARVLDECGAKFFGVSNVQEGILLREAGFKQRILLFETTLPELAPAIVDFELTPTICTFELALAIHDYARSLNKHCDVHLKVDTAMGRLGLPLKGAIDFLQRLKPLDHLVLEGVYTHFPSADSDEKLTLRQIKAFMDFLNDCQVLGIEFEYVHAANSIAFVSYKNVFLNLARPGLMLYGLYPNKVARANIELKPALSVVSKVIFLKRLERGQGVSYGQAFVAERDMTVAVLPIGYNDGYCRAFSNRAYVLIDGKRCPVLGRVTMDQTMVDASRVISPRLGMPAVILGESREAAISADDLANWASTINYEILCNLGNRLPRVYKS